MRTGAIRVTQIAVLLLAGCASRQIPHPTRLPVEARAWRIQRLDAAPDTFGAFAGRPVIVNFWATWCGPCVQELGSFERLTEALRGTDVAFVFVTSESDERVRRFSQRYGFDLPFYTEVEEAPASLGVRALPTTIVIDRTGRIVLHHRGAIAWDDPAIIAHLRELAAT